MHSLTQKKVIWITTYTCLAKGPPRFSMFYATNTVDFSILQLTYGWVNTILLWGISGLIFCTRLNARNNLRHLETETEAQVYELDVHPDGRDSLRSQAPRNRVCATGIIQSILLLMCEPGDWSSWISQIS